jgi:hypothetical protein
MKCDEEELPRVPGDIQERYDKQIRAIAERMCEYVRKYGKIVRMPREEWRFGQMEEEVLEMEYNDVTRNQFRWKYVEEGKAMNRYFHGKWWEFLDEVRWEYPLYWREEGENRSVVLYRTAEEMAGYGFKRAHLEADGETKGEDGGDLTESDEDQEELILGEEEDEDEEAHWSGLKGAEAIGCDGDAMSISS